jgi:hypothetical protein
MPGTGALFLLAFASLVAAVLLVLLQLTRLGYLVRSTIPDRPRRRMFIASFSFLLTFVGVRILVHRIVNHEGRLQWVVIHGTHIHHLVWGILILLLVGYGWLLDLGRSHSQLSIFLSRLMSVGYGVGAALNIDAIILFGALLAVGAGGAPFFRGLHLMWDKRALVGKGLGRGLAFPMRRARLLRPHKVHRSGPRIAP